MCVVFWFFAPKLMLPNLEDVAEIIAASPLCNKCNMNATQLPEVKDVFIYLVCFFVLLLLFHVKKI